ncbi:MAG: histidine kinase [Bacteroidia bacterium]
MIALKNNYQGICWEFCRWQCFSVFLSTCFYLFFNTLAAQTPYLRQFKVVQGLAANETYQLLTDSAGFLWVAGEGGLARYNGYAFQYFPRQKPAIAQFSNPQIDKKGRIWGHDFLGNIFYWQKDTIGHFRAWNAKWALGFVETDLIAGKYLFVNTRKEVYLFDISLPNTPLLRKFSWAFSVEHSIFNNQYVYRQRDSIFFISPITQNYQAFPVLLPADYRLSFFEYHGNLYAVATHPQKGEMRALWRWEGNTFQALTQFKCAHINRICVEGEDIFFCTNKGLRQYSLQNGQLSLEKHYRPEDMVSCALKDQLGNLWFSTLKSGIFHLPNAQIFQLPLPATDKEQEISSLTQSKTGLLVGLNNGRGYLLQDTSFTLVQAHTYPHYNTTMLLRPPYLYYATDKVYKLNLQNGAQEVIFDYAGAKELYVFGNHGIMVRAHDIKYLAKQGNTLPNLLKGCMPKKTMKPNIWQISSERAQGFGLDKGLEYGVLARKSGIEKIKGGTREIVKYGNDTLRGNLFRWQENTNTAWLARENEGLYQIPPQSPPIFHPFPLSDFQVRKFCPSDTYLWLLGNEQLLRYDTQKHSWTVFNAEEIGINLRWVTQIEAQNHHLYLAEGNYLYFFQEQLAPPPPYYPQVYAQTFYSDDSAFGSAESLRFSLSNSNISVQVGCIALRGNGKFRFQYHLTGAAENSGFADHSQSRIGFGHLPGGDYTLTLTSLSTNGNLSPHPKVHHFYVPPPIWQRWYFLLGFIFLIFSILYLFINRRLTLQTQQNQVLVEKEKLQKALKESQLAAIKSQMNPHFIFNALNTIQIYIYKNDPDQANFFLSKFSQLMRKILEMSNQEKVLLSEEIEALRLYLDLEQMRFSQSLVYEIRVAENVDTEELKIPSMLIQPYIENAIKHGLLHLTDKQREVLVSFCLVGENTLQVVIEDNGVGLTRSAEINQREFSSHRSYAVAANRKRLEILNEHRQKPIGFAIYERKNKQGDVLGTKVELTIPIENTPL